jgi:hypothetical protein
MRAEGIRISRRVLVRSDSTTHFSAEGGTRIRANRRALKTEPAVAPSPNDASTALWASTSKEFPTTSCGYRSAHIRVAFRSSIKAIAPFSTPYAIVAASPSSRVASRRPITSSSKKDSNSAWKHCETALKPAPIQNSSLIRPGYDQRIRALLTLARALWLGGYASRAVTVATQALHQATALDHPVSLCLCGIYRVTLFLWTGEWSEGYSIIDRLIAYAEKYSLRCHHAICLGLKGELSLRQDDTEAGLRLLNASLDSLEVVQHQTMTPVFTSDLAIGWARAARPDEADAAIDKAMAFGPHFYLPEMMRIKGQLLASGPHAAEAEYWFSRSPDLAREQSALAWELRTATTFAHLRARQGRVTRHCASCDRYMTDSPKDSTLSI